MPCGYGFYTGLSIPGTGWETTDPHPLRDGFSWRSGFDISLGPHRSGNEVLKDYFEESTLEKHGFHTVDKDFELKVGMKIGIVVYTIEDVTKEQALRGDKELETQLEPEKIEIHDIYGDPTKVAIYTRQITHVSEDYFEHDMNTFQGCSGAVVFLTDRGQPDTVSTKDYKKATGVLAGNKNDLKAGIAFKLQNALETSKEGWMSRWIRCLVPGKK